MRLTVETCPHYLTLTAEEIPDGGSEFKCCPPIRGEVNRDLLWEGLLAGTIDAIVSDHSPSTEQLKRNGDGHFGLAWGGISGLQVGLSAVWTEARRRGVPLERLIPLFTTGPAAVAGVEGVGVIAEGAPAHLTVFGPDDPHTVDARALLHRNPVSAYDGRRLVGRIRRTWLRGRSVFDLTEGGAGAAPQYRRPPAGLLLTAPHRRLSARPREDERVSPGILQPGTGDILGAHYLAATPATVLWGRLPCADDTAVLTIASGETVTIDTISHEGILDDQGRDPLAFFGAHGVPADHVLLDAIEVAASDRDPTTDGAHVVTGPIRVYGAEPGDLLQITVVRLEPRVPYGVISNRHGRGALAG